jgi:hypothetical protein
MFQLKLHELYPIISSDILYSKRWHRKARNPDIFLYVLLTADFRNSRDASSRIFLPNVAFLWQLQLNQLYPMVWSDFPNNKRWLVRAQTILILSNVQSGVNPTQSNDDSSRSLFPNISMLIPSTTRTALSNGILRFSITKIGIFTVSIGPSLIPKILFRYGKIWPYPWIELTQF